MFVSFGVLMIGRRKWWMISFGFLASKLPLMDDSHRMRWKLMKDRDFNIRSFYHKLCGSSFMVFPYKGIWKVKAPCHVSFFVWIAA